MREEEEEEEQEREQEEDVENVDLSFFSFSFFFRAHSARDAKSLAVTPVRNSRPAARGIAGTLLYLRDGEAR